MFEKLLKTLPKYSYTGPGVIVEKVVTRASAGIVRKVVTRATAGTAPPVPGNLPRIAQCCCHAAVTNRSIEPLSFVFLNLQAVSASVIHVSCLTNRGRWKVFFTIKVIMSLVLTGVIDEFVQNCQITKIKVI